MMNSSSSEVVLVGSKGLFTVCTLLWVTASNTNLPEVLMAAVMLERTHLEPSCASSLLISSSSSRLEHYLHSIRADTHTLSHPFMPSCGWTQLQKQNPNTHISLKHTHGHAHASFPTAPKLLRGFQTARHVSDTLTDIWKCPLKAEKDCLFLFKQVTTHSHTAWFYGFSVHRQCVRLKREQ